MDGKIRYEKPDMEIITLADEDVVRTSALTETEISEGGKGGWDSF